MSEETKAWLRNLSHWFDAVGALSKTLDIQGEPLQVIAEYENHAPSLRARPRREALMWLREAKHCRLSNDEEGFRVNFYRALMVFDAAENEELVAGTRIKKKGGVAAARTNKEKSDQIKAKVLAAYDAMTIPERSRAAALSNRQGFPTVRTIRRYVQQRKADKS